LPIAIFRLARVSPASPVTIYCILFRAGLLIAAFWII